jgi:hypothetical protein
MTMKRVGFVLVTLLCLMGLSAIYAQTAPVAATLTVAAERSDLVNSDSMKLVLSVKSASFREKGKVTFNMPSGCSVKPQDVTIPEFTDQFETNDVHVTCDKNAVEGTQVVRARLEWGSPISTSGASASFSYVRRIPMWSYFALGFAGILLGYGLRIILQVQAAIGTPPIPLTVNEDTPKPGPITVFVTGHYYAVDMSIAVIMGLLSMVVLLKTGHVPDTATYWHQALVLGVGLGLLTNTALVLRLKPTV